MSSITRKKQPQNGHNNTKLSSSRHNKLETTISKIHKAKPDDEKTSTTSATRQTKQLITPSNKHHTSIKVDKDPQPLQPTKKRPAKPFPMTTTTTTGTRKPPAVIRQSRSIAVNKPVTTPPSRRVSSTQFFPSKKMYANALKPSGEQDTTRTKQATIHHQRNRNDISPDTTSSTTSERPGTATLSRGRIVNKNIAGPEAPQPRIVHHVPQINHTPDNNDNEASSSSANYDDEDFDSYESDFEAATSSSSSSSTSMSSTEENSSNNNISSRSSSEDDEKDDQVKSALTIQNNFGSTTTVDDEKKLDSGTYDLIPEFKHKQILDNIKEAIEKENANLHPNNLASLSDEGFEEAKSLQFINFLGAQKMYQHRKSVAKQRKRGEEILNMIKLDTFSFTLLDIPPVPYEIFIKTFGKTNTVQATMQTGDEDLSEQVQTDLIELKNKWTQCPTVQPKIDEAHTNFWAIYKCNYLGVGGNEDEIAKSPIMMENRTNHDDIKLERFLLSAGNLICNLQAERSNILHPLLSNSSNIPFTKGMVMFKAQSIWDLNLIINNVCFCPNNPHKLLTLHNSKNEKSQESILCLWNVTDPKQPDIFLKIFGKVTCCIFGLQSTDFIFAGLQDGSIAIWDIKESSTHHASNLLSSPNIDANSSSTSNIFLRTPTYRTSIENGHGARVISLHSLPLMTEKLSKLFNINETKEICSLDETGELIIWSVLVKHENNGKVLDPGLAHWGTVLLKLNRRISLQHLHPDIDGLQCTDSTVSPQDPNHLYVSTNHGVIIHCLINGARTNVKKFGPDTHYHKSQANCLEACPFSPQYILCGYDNGNVSFYSRSLERPLITVSKKNDNNCRQNSIDLIQWSYNRPLVFYTKDAANTVHVWDLRISDLVPACSIPFEEEIICMKLSASECDDKDNQDTYMAISTSTGLLYLYLLDDNYGRQSLNNYKEDTKKFLNYINRYV